LKTLCSPLLLLLLLSTSTSSFAAVSQKNQFYIDSFSYEDFVYSRSKKTELGDQVEIEVAAKYIYRAGTYARFRFETSPEENRENNESSKFEFFLSHKYETVMFNLDLELQTNKSTNGGTSIGIDLDSEYTNIKWEINKSFTFTFFPFNFDGEVGEEFRTWDVTRVKTIEGAPTTVSNSPTGSEKIVEKTIPGFVLNFNPGFVEGLGLYVGFGIASYFYPTNSDFDLLTNTSVTSWERKEDKGYKFGMNFDRQDLDLKIEFVGHDEAKETGALLEYAGSFYLITKLDKLVFDTEFTMSKAGESPWFTTRGTTWFETTSPFRKVYSDFFGNNKQDWIGKTDFAAGARIGYRMGDVTPYVLFRYQGKNFIFVENESAHLLRTADESLSHGGLTRVGTGAFLSYGKWVVNPEFELRNAKNPVFGNASDVRSNRLLSTFRKTDYLITLFVTYDFDGKNLFLP
jgi:hypothetical protein